MVAVDKTEVRFLPAGDTAVVVEFGDVICRQINRKVRSFCSRLARANLEGFVEAVPTYRSALVYYNPSILDWDQVIEKLQSLLDVLETDEPGPRRVTVIPTAYGGEFGPDLDFVASFTGLTPDEVVRIHTSRTYFVYMMGFIPGYPYMGGMDERIAAPRLGTPRLRTPAGSVGIAGSQTGIYPLETPGGWRIIGRTPLVLFDPEREEPSLLQAGSYVRFKSISVEEYRDIETMVKQRRYYPEVYDEQPDY